MFPYAIGEPIHSSLNNGYLAVFILKITGLLLGGIAFFGYWRVYSSRVLLAPTAITISLTGIMLGAFILDFISYTQVLHVGIFSFAYYVYYSDPAIGVIFIFWGSTIWIVRSYLMSNSFSKATCILLLFSGIFIIVFPIPFMFAGILAIVFPIGVDFYLVLQISLALLIMVTLFRAAVFVNQSKELLVLDMVKEKPREFIDVEKIIPKLSRLRKISLMLIILGFILCLPRFTSNPYSSFVFAIIAFFIVALGLTLAGIAFVGYHLCYRSSISLVAGIVSIFFGWLLLINEIIHGSAAVSYSGRWGIPMYASVGQYFVAYITFFLIGYAMLGVIFIFQALAIRSLRKPATKLFQPVRAPALYFIGGFTVLCSIPFVSIMLIQSNQLISEGIGFLSQHPPILETLGLFWGIFSLLISFGIIFEYTSSGTEGNLFSLNNTRMNS